MNASRSDHENPELTAEDFRRAQPALSVLPKDVVAAIRRYRTVSKTRQGPARRSRRPDTAPALEADITLMLFTRITVDAKQMGGMPCIRNLRIPVATVVEMVADRMTDSEILTAYPDLEAEDIREALQFAAEAIRLSDLPLLPRN